jgi:predicted nucleotidyltransferase
MTDIAGFSSRETELMREVFRRHPEISAVILYGSRARGTHKPESDVDLAIEGAVDDLRAEAIAAEMDELPLPYRFDVKAYAAVQSAALREDIRSGVTVYGETTP